MHGLLMKMEQETEQLARKKSAEENSRQQLITLKKHIADLQLYKNTLEESCKEISVCSIYSNNYVLID